MIPASAHISLRQARRALFWFIMASLRVAIALALLASIVALKDSRAASPLAFSASRSVWSLVNSPSAQVMAFSRFFLASSSADLIAKMISFFISARASAVSRVSSVIWEWMFLESSEISVVMRLFIWERVLALMSFIFFSMARARASPFAMASVTAEWRASLLASDIFFSWARPLASLMPM